MTRVTIILMTLAFSLHAQFEITGFADFLYDGTGSQNAFSYGQLEVDLSTQVSDKVGFEAAIAYNAETGQFEAGAGFVHLSGTDKHDRVAWGVAVGQFDVPFGIDYRHIASPDRWLVCSPLANQATIDSWNDMGVIFEAQTDHFEVVSFAVNGSEEGHAVGGRVGATPVKRVNVGTSYFIQTAVNPAGGKPQAFGGDVTVGFPRMELRSEYYQSKAIVAADFDSHHNDDIASGYYVQASHLLVESGPFPVMAIMRFGGSEQVAQGETATCSRFTGGIRCYPLEGFEIRIQSVSMYEDDHWSKPGMQVQCVVAI